MAIATGTDPLNLIWVMPAEGGAVRRLAIRVCAIAYNRPAAAGRFFIPIAALFRSLAQGGCDDVQ
ncbi:hypothetical protein Cagg_3164 [Chloroflexus aggregans DSM 9485]|uniref:Uncharacterized protein n=1 Tax=Chloroflexus aggregans (strain MD-66 / DSM 9485) TaxID=326427 RepID=B8G7I7_CHLAD|nr:hypothetical protein Cagg_3164 [Chloroflexus aggregans DSM 9485]